MCILLFQDTTTARKVGYMLKAEFDGSTAIKLAEPIDRIAVQTALSACRAEYCCLGDGCLWFSPQIIRFETELKYLGYQICYPIEWGEQYSPIQVQLESLENIKTQNKRVGFYFVDTQEFYFKDRMCQYLITTDFTLQTVIETKGNWAEAALVPQGLPEGKTGIDGISTEIQAAAQWWTDLLKQERYKNAQIRSDLCLYSSQQLELFKQALFETIAEKISWTGYDPTNPVDGSSRRCINSSDIEIKKAASIANIEFIWRRDLSDNFCTVINPGVVTVFANPVSTYGSRYIKTIYKYPDEQFLFWNLIKWFQGFFKKNKSVKN